MSDEPNGHFVRITNREVYDRLGAVEGKLDHALSTIALRDATIAEYGKRIRGLELIAALAVLVRLG
jgi:hypothetical protein